MAERRRKVMAAVVAIVDYRPFGGSFEGGVLAFHVRHFGLPECLPDADLRTIQADLRWLERQGFVRRVDGRPPHAFEPTDEGRVFARG